MGDTNRHLLAMGSMMVMRCADIEATRDLDRVMSPWSAPDGPGSATLVGTPSSLETRTSS